MTTQHEPAADKHAWTEVTVETVAPGIHRIPVQMPTDGLRATNVYALVGADSVGLVDAGWFEGDAMGDLERGLKELGAELRDIRDVIVTHIHADHYTLAVELMRRYGCRIHLGSGEQQWLHDMRVPELGARAFTEAVVRAGFPRDDVQLTQHADHGGSKYAPPTAWIEDGDTFLLGGMQVEAIATPGHTRGHVCYAVESAGVLFTGDHVLPRITPSVGFESPDHAHRALIDYLDSLRLLRARPNALMLPAHGPVRATVHERVDELIAHHDRRLDQCLAALTAGPGTAYDVARQVPWTSRETPLEALSHMDQLMAILETRAHLEYLDDKGLVTRSGRELERYALVAG